MYPTKTRKVGDTDQGPSGREESDERNACDHAMCQQHIVCSHLRGTYAAADKTAA